MKKLMVILAVCAVCLSAQAQTTKVIALDDKDAWNIRQLYECKARTEAEIERVTKQIEDTYTKRQVTRTTCNGDCKNVERRERLPGWEGGIEFSTDYKFIVPKIPKTIDTPQLQPGRSLSCSGSKCVVW